MQRFPFIFVAVLMIGLSLFFLPVAVRAQSGSVDRPSIAQVLVREGTFAVDLQSGMNLGASRDESVAEHRLSRAGIAPENGWISDEPVTPEIIGQIQDSIIHATDNGWLHMGKKEALDRFQTIASSFNLPVKPYAGQTGTGEYASTYSDQADLDSYYAQEGPPFITYYTPPPDYYGMYTWVPYPFWWYDVPFSGYYILNGPVFIGHDHGFRHHHHDHHREGHDQPASSASAAGSHAPGVPTIESRPAHTDPGANSGRVSSPATSHARAAGSPSSQIHREMFRENDHHRYDREPPASRATPAVSPAPGVPTIESQPPAIPNARMTPPSAPGTTVHHFDHPSAAGHVDGRGPVTGHPGGPGPGMHGGFHAGR